MMNPYEQWLFDQQRQVMEKYQRSLSPPVSQPAQNQPLMQVSQPAQNQQLVQFSEPTQNQQSAQALQLIQLPQAAQNPQLIQLPPLIQNQQPAQAQQLIQLPQPEQTQQLIQLPPPIQNQQPVRNHRSLHHQQPTQSRQSTQYTQPVQYTQLAQVIQQPQYAQQTQVQQQLPLTSSAQLQPPLQAPQVQNSHYEWPSGSAPPCQPLLSNQEQLSKLLQRHDQWQQKHQQLYDHQLEEYRIQYDLLAFPRRQSLNLPQQSFNPQQQFIDSPPPQKQALKGLPVESELTRKRKMPFGDEASRRTELSFAKLNEHDAMYERDAELQSQYIVELSTRAQPTTHGPTPLLPVPSIPLVDTSIWPSLEVAHEPLVVIGTVTGAPTTEETDPSSSEIRGMTSELVTLAMAGPDSSTLARNEILQFCQSQHVSLRNIGALLERLQVYAKPGRTSWTRAECEKLCSTIRLVAKMHFLMLTATARMALDLPPDSKLTHVPGWDGMDEFMDRVATRTLIERWVTSNKNPEIQIMGDSSNETSQDDTSSKQPVSGSSIPAGEKYSSQSSAPSSKDHSKPNHAT